MERPAGVLLLVAVCAMLAIVSAAVEAGKVSGADYSTVLPIGNIGFGWWHSGHSGNSNSVQTNSSAILKNPTGNSSVGKGGQSSNKTSTQPQIITPYPNFSGLPSWLLPTAAVAALGCALLLVFRIRISTNPIDLEHTVDEMEQQRKSLEETWSYKMKNSALLQYYILMRKACLRLGLRDGPSETPQEYIGRASSFFKVDESEAARFASAVNRSRYGQELNETEVGEASKFMGSFADVIRRKAGEIR